MPAQPVITVRGLRKSYGRTVAIDDVSFEVIGGEIAVLGLDPVRDVYELQQRIGVQLQAAQLQKRIKVWEAVDLWAALYRSHVDARRLLEQLGLAEKRNAWFM